MFEEARIEQDNGTQASLKDLQRFQLQKNNRLAWNWYISRSFIMPSLSWSHIYSRQSSMT